MLQETCYFSVKQPALEVTRGTPLGFLIFLSSHRKHPVHQNSFFLQESNFLPWHILFLVLISICYFISICAPHLQALILFLALSPASGYLLVVSEGCLKGLQELSKNLNNAEDTAGSLIPLRRWWLPATSYWVLLLPEPQLVSYCFSLSVSPGGNSIQRLSLVSELRISLVLSLSLSTGITVSCKLNTQLTLQESLATLNQVTKATNKTILLDAHIKFCR